MNLLSGSLHPISFDRNFFLFTELNGWKKWFRFEFLHIRKWIKWKWPKGSIVFLSRFHTHCSLLLFIVNGKIGNCCFAQREKKFKFLFVPIWEPRDERIASILDLLVELDRPRYIIIYSFESNDLMRESKMPHSYSWFIHIHTLKQILSSFLVYIRYERWASSRHWWFVAFHFLQKVKLNVTIRCVMCNVWLKIV